MNWPTNILVWRCWCLLNYNKGSECETVLIKETYHLLQVSLVARSTDSHGFIRKHFSSLSNLHSYFHSLYTNRNMHTCYYSFLLTLLDHLWPLNVTLIQPAIPVWTLKQFNKLLALWCQLIGSSLCSGWCGHSAVEWQWTQTPEKGHQLSSCSLTAVSVMFCFPDIDLL